MDWFLNIAPLSRHALTAGACLIGTLGLSTLALADEAPVAPLTEQELSAESYQVDFKPPARGEKEKGDKKKGEKEETEHRGPGKPGEHGQRGKHGDKEKAEHRGFGKPGMHPAWDGQRPSFGGHGFQGHASGGPRSGHPGFGGPAMHGMAMHHGFGPMQGGHGRGGFGPGHGKPEHAGGMQMGMMHQQMQIKALEQKVERLANAIRGGMPEMKKPEHAPGREGSAKPGMPGMHGMPDIANPAVAIHRLMAENAQLKEKVARLESALKSDKPAPKKEEAKKEEAKKAEAPRRPDAAGPGGPMMRGGFGGFPGRGFEGMRGEGGPRGPIARGPRDGERPQAGPRDGQRPQAGPRDGERRERGEREGDKKESDRRSENTSENREGFVLDTNGDGINDSPAAVAVEVAVIDAE